MKKLYTANDILEARLLDLMLQRDGLDSLLKNEHLQSGIGEIPFVEMWPEVWVTHHADWARAVEVLERFQQIKMASDWLCPHCFEVNPGTFETCWYCAEVRTGYSDKEW